MALTAAADQDLAPLERLLAALATPFDYARVPAEFAEPAAPDARPHRTFLLRHLGPSRIESGQ